MLTIRVMLPGAETWLGRSKLKLLLHGVLASGSSATYTRRFRLRDVFGGDSLEGPFQGAWVTDDGNVYEETSYRLEVMIEPGQLQMARELVIRRMGKKGS